MLDFCSAQKVVCKIAIKNSYSYSLRFKLLLVLTFLGAFILLCTK
jgi:hypothetical protein